jgi:hypothetical protein
MDEGRKEKRERERERERRGGEGSAGWWTVGLSLPVSLLARDPGVWEARLASERRGSRGVLKPAAEQSRAEAASATAGGR